mgnify:CR=1 FL=1
MTVPDHMFDPFKKGLHRPRYPHMGRRFDAVQTIAWPDQRDLSGRTRQPLHRAAEEREQAHETGHALPGRRLRSNLPRGDLQDTAEAFQNIVCMLAGSSWRIGEGYSGRIITAPRPVITGQRPEVSGFGAFAPG